MAETSSSKFNYWIFSSYHTSVEGLGLFRIFTAFFLLLFALPSRVLYSFVGSLPDNFFSPPPGPMMLFNGFPSEQVFLVLHYLLIVSLVLLLLGYRTRLMAIATGLLLLAIKGFIYSLGKADHDLLLVIVPLVMAFSGWGKAYSVDALRSNNQNRSPECWTLTLLALIIGFMFFTAGFPKILGGWLDLGTQASQGHFFKHFFIRGRQDLLAHFALNFGPVVWEWFDYSTVLFEVGFLVAIIHPRSTRIFICLAVFFHFGTMMILNISFLPNFLAFAAFLNWSWINKVIKQKTQGLSLSTAFKHYGPAAGVALFMLLMASLIAFLAGRLHFVSDLTAKEFVWVSAAVLVAFYYLGKQVRNFIN